MTKPDTTPSNAKLEQLRTVLQWEGQIDNARIRDLLDVQIVWASRLLAELMTDMSDRVSRPRKHGPVMLASGEMRKKASPESYLRILAAAQEVDSPDGIVHDARMDLTRVSPAIFAAVRDAAARGTGLQIVYRSMSSPVGQSRVVYPHAIVRAPRRWHMRAWCSLRQDFRDFVLARVDSVKIATDDVPGPQRSTEDASWQSLVDLVLVPHPALTIDQQRMVANEFFPNASAKRLRVRRALAGYVLQDLRVATDPTTQKPPEYQLLLAPESNARGFESALE